MRMIGMCYLGVERLMRFCGFRIRILLEGR